MRNAHSRNKIKNCAKYSPEELQSNFETKYIINNSYDFINNS